MSLPNPKIFAVAAVVVAVVGAVVFCSVPEDESVPSPPVDASAPFDVPVAWSEHDIERQIGLDTDPTLRWRHGDDILLEGPGFDDLQFDRESADRDGWNLLIGESAMDGGIVEIRIWTAQGFPHAIIEANAYVDPSASGNLPKLTTVVDADDALWLTGRFQQKDGFDALEDSSVAAGRFSRNGITFQLHSPDGTGDVVDTDDGRTVIEWPIAPGEDSEHSDCLDDPPSRIGPARLVVSFGDQPTIFPSPVSAQVQSLTTPIFTDAPPQSDDSFADGRARNATDLARRYRALAFGHSDRNDPRYGNGGLLAAGLGAVFAVPARWWNEPRIERLRQSLENTKIDVVPDDASRHRTDSIAVIDPDDCDAPVSLRDDTIAVIRSADDNPARRNLLETPAPVVEAGSLPTDRDELLDRLFVSNHDDGLVTDGEHRIGFVPVVATRNPLESIASHQILSPESNGHWTLDRSLTRRLTQLEMTGDSGVEMVGLQAPLEDFRNQRRIYPHWAPDGMLEVEGDAEHLLAFGAVDDLDIDATRLSADLVAWPYDATALPSVDEQPQAVVFETLSAQ